MITLIEKKCVLGLLFTIKLSTISASVFMGPLAQLVEQ